MDDFNGIFKIITHQNHSLCDEEIKALNTLVERKGPQNFIVHNVILNDVLQHLDIYWMEMIHVIYNECLQENENIPKMDYMMDKIYLITSAKYWKTYTNEE